MKKAIVFAILVTFSLNVMAQKYALYKGDTINRTDKKGLKQGTWKRYYRNDTLYYSGLFKDNKPIGTFIYHYKDGRLQGKNRFFENGKKSFFTGYYRNGKMQAQGVYNNQRKDSIWKYFNEFEQLSSTESYLNGIPHGTWFTYYTDTLSKVSEMNWNNGHKTGLWRLYYRNGQLKSDAYMVDSNFVGLVKIYYPTGHLKILGHYNKLGYADSTWTFYRETPEGEIDHKEEFRWGNSINPPKELEEPINEEKPKKESEE